MNRKVRSQDFSPEFLSTLGAYYKPLTGTRWDMIFSLYLSAILLVRSQIL
ncbi:hypothetical protein [Fischerella sp. PCC 9605]|nr:hypothetical protein [Fischerella sp. PCC 9605]